MIVITLDTVEKRVNKWEVRQLLRASCTYEGVYYEEVGKDNNLKPLIKRVPWQESHFNDLLRVERGGTTCFDLVALKSWLFPTNNQPAQFRKN